MCKSPTNNSLASWDLDVIEREKKEMLDTVPGIRFRFWPKTELISVGYPCVGWLLLLRRWYTHRCLKIWLPPAASDWIQGWDSAPQNTTRKHKMASHSSAILVLLKNTRRSTFPLFSEDAISRWRKSVCSIDSDGESILCQAQRRSQETEWCAHSHGYKVREKL